MQGITALESQEQAAYFEWAQYIPELKWAHAIPNGGRRDKKEAANLKRQGVKAGVSDIFIPLARGKYHGLYIELKTKTGKPSAEQKEFISDMHRNGYAAVFCYGAEEAIEATKQYLKLKKG